MRFLTNCFVGLLLFVSTSVSANQFVFNGNGSWATASNWLGGSIGGFGANDTITITGNALFEGTHLDLRGTIIVASSGIFHLKVLFQIYNWGLFVVNGTFINETNFINADFNGITGIMNVNGIVNNKRGTGNAPVSFRNDAILNISSTGIFNNLGSLDNIHQWQGIINLNGGVINNSGVFIMGAFNNNGGTVNVSGSSTITGNLVNSGVMAPGNSPGTVSITGSYTATTSAIHNFEVAGITTNTYDRLAVSGPVNLNGTLTVSLIDGFNPPNTNHDIPIITGTRSGTFSSVSLPPAYSLIYTPTQVLLRRNVTLPVEFLNFTAVREGYGNLLTWKVAEELNVLHYEIEKSNNGSEFKSIGTVNASLLTSYQFKDLQTELKSFYRIKSIDHDGSFQYSSIVLLNGGKGEVVVRAFPNPVQQDLIIQHPTAGEKARIVIASLDGRIVFSTDIREDKQQTKLDLSALQSGLYIISFYNGKEEVKTASFIKL